MSKALLRFLFSIWLASLGVTLSFMGHEGLGFAVSLFCCVHGLIGVARETIKSHRERRKLAAIRRLRSDLEFHTQVTLQSIHGGRWRN